MVLLALRPGAQTHGAVRGGRRRQACGTIAMMHAIANNTDKITLEDGYLKSFVEKTRSLTSAERGAQLEVYPQPVCCVVHLLAPCRLGRRHEHASRSSCHAPLPDLVGALVEGGKDEDEGEKPRHAHTHTEKDR